MNKVGLEVDNSKGYQHMVHCSNCNWFDVIYIPYKVTIEDYLKSQDCERCKCAGVLY